MGCWAKFIRLRENIVFLCKISNVIWEWENESN